MNEKSQLIEQLVALVKKKTEDTLPGWQDFPFDENECKKAKKCEQDRLFKRITDMKKGDLAFLLFHIIDKGEFDYDDKYLLESGAIDENDCFQAALTILNDLSIVEIKEKIEIEEEELNEMDLDWSGDKCG